MTSLKETIQHDLTTAMKSKDAVVTGTLRMVIAAITTEEVSGKESRELTDQDVITVLTREAKKRREASVAYIDAKRPELAAKEDEELEVISKYLPTALTPEEVNAIIAQAVATAASNGQSGPSAMGAVMKIVQPQVAGRADGSQIAGLVKQALA